MMENLLLVLIFLPAVVGLVVLPLRRFDGVKRAAVVLATAANLIIAAALFTSTLTVRLPWAGSGMEFSLRLYHFSGFIILAAAGFAFLVSIYCVSFLKNHPRSNQFFCYMLVSLTMANGAILSDNLVLMLFFWEGLLGVLFGMVAIGGAGAFRTATKMFIIVGLSDICMMAGVAITGWLARAAGAEHFLSMAAIAQLGLTAHGLGAAAMILLMIGAIAKGGSMPFHSWIPDAAVDAPLPFMAFMPASLEKLLGIYLLTRITLDLYHIQPQSWTSVLMMIIGALTIVLAVMMALVQKNYKRLLSYHAISQVGYMVLGVGTALPIGIVGGLFHMLNNAIYKSCLFLTAGSVEKQAGTTDLEKLGGIARQMPVTFACYFVAAIAISGTPPTNGFYSKELIYNAAMTRGYIFYAAAIIGTFFTAASFLKLGHAAYLGKRGAGLDNVKEAPLPMLVPMMVLAAACILFGVYNALPLGPLSEAVVGSHPGAETFAGIMPHDWILASIAVLALAGALFNHLAGARINGSGLKAVDHVHYAPLLAGIYERAERRVFDPYDIGLTITALFTKVLWGVDRIIDWIYDVAAVVPTLGAAGALRRFHNGNYSLYVLWAAAGAALVIVYLLKVT